MVVSYGNDPGYFMKQYVDSGARRSGGRFRVLAGCGENRRSAYQQFMFAVDYLDFDNPPNPLSEFFVEDYQRLFVRSRTPTSNRTTTTAVWPTSSSARRVAADGGDINDGTALQDALEADPTLPSVYGGTPDEVGKVELSPETHDPT